MSHSHDPEGSIEVTSLKGQLYATAYARDAISWILSSPGAIDQFQAHLKERGRERPCDHEDHEKNLDHLDTELVTKALRFAEMHLMMQVTVMESLGIE